MRKSWTKEEMDEFLNDPAVKEHDKKREEDLKGKGYTNLGWCFPPKDDKAREEFLEYLKNQPKP